jgi:RNA polymerase sigma factor FliA
MMTPSLREELILSHMPQVKLLAQRLHRCCPHVELEDLISAGTIGLIQAVDRFDPARNLKLKTLAEHRISGALLDYLRHIDPLPRDVRRFQKQRDANHADVGRW